MAVDYLNQIRSVGVTIFSRFSKLYTCKRSEVDQKCQDNTISKPIGGF
jgi:hypothetical protein